MFPLTAIPPIKKIAAIKEQLHALADLIPPAKEGSDGDSEGGWSDLDEEDGLETDEEDAEVEQLLATGVISLPKPSKGKGKEVKGANVGHIIFTDDKDECK